MTGVGEPIWEDAVARDVHWLDAREIIMAEATLSTTSTRSAHQRRAQPLAARVDGAWQRVLANRNAPRAR